MELPPRSTRGFVFIPLQGQGSREIGKAFDEPSADQDGYLLCNRALHAGEDYVSLLEQGTGV